MDTCAWVSTDACDIRPLHVRVLLMLLANTCHCMVSHCVCGLGELTLSLIAAVEKDFCTPASIRFLQYVMLTARQ
jgi:hypothetical protein